MTDAEVQVGNTTVCQTPSVLRQAAYEKSQADLLHPDVHDELDIAKKALKASMPGVHVNGYIQQLGSEPFHIIFYIELPVSSYISARKTSVGATIHIDATGMVIKRIPDKRHHYITP